VPSFAYRVSGFNRRRKWEIFLREFAPQPSDRVLDVGFSDAEYSDTDNFLEKHYLHRSQITALGIDAPSQFPGRYPDVKVVQYEGREFPFADGEFDIAWSNAVIEHVGRHEGRREAQVLFLREIARVSKSAFVTTPNKRFPIEVHTRTPLLHWLPKSWFDRYLGWRGIDWATGDYMDLLSLSELRGLLRDAGITKYRILQNRLLGLTLDFVVMMGERISARPAQ
jgi:hypothetical protein